jgi:hypothetical protein
MRTTHYPISFSLAAVLAACSSSPSPDPEPPALERSFDVTATLSYSGAVDPSGLPDSERLVLRLDQARTGSVAAIWGAELGTAESTFERTDTGVALRGEVSFAVASREPLSFEASISFDSLDLELIDSDGDGEIDALEGTGTGVFNHVLGDVEVDHPFTVELRGEPDTTPPELVIEGDPAAHSVTEPLRIVASEPLHPDTRIVLRHGDETIPMAHSPADGKYVRSFVTRALLPFATDLSVELTSPLQDLSGLVSDNVSITVRTMPDPGLFGEDGFEGEPTAFTGGAELVAGVGTVPAIAGARSLLLESGEALTMRVPLSGGERHLRFEARALAPQDRSVCLSFEIRLGFPGLPPERDTEVRPLMPSREPLEGTGDATWGSAGPVTTVEVPLPEGAAGEVIVDLYEPAPIPGPPCLETALLIDDLRAE